MGLTRSNDCPKVTPVMERNNSDSQQGVGRTVLRYIFLPFFVSAYLSNLLLLIPTSAVLGSEIAFVFDRSVFKATRWRTITSAMFYSEDANIYTMYGLCCVAGEVFAAIHCLAWYFAFPSHVEQIMWRVAALVITISCAYTALMVVVAQPILSSITRHGSNYYRHLINSLAVMIGLSMILLTWILSLMYPLARCALLVLSLTTLRSLPSSALETVQWIELVPHV